MFWSISNFDWRQQCRRETTADNIQQDPVSLNGRHPGRSVHGDEALDLASQLAAAADASRVDLSDLGRRARRPLAALPPFATGSGLHWAERADLAIQAATPARQLADSLAGRTNLPCTSRRRQTCLFGEDLVADGSCLMASGYAIALCPTYGKAANRP